MTRSELEARDPSYWNSFLRYEPETGEFFWTRTVGRCREGQAAGSINAAGYRYIPHQGIGVRANRLAWFLVHGEWPRLHVDHINGNRTDNRISNLRLATNAQNMRNTRVYAGNTTGAKGVARTPLGKYRAHIRVRGKRIWLGTFDAIEDAIGARAAAEMDHGFSGQDIVANAPSTWRKAREARLVRDGEPGEGYNNGESNV